MLKFLHNRQEDKSPKRSPIKYLPEMCYGNSFEAPQEFQTTNTIFHSKTYLSPFLKFQKERLAKMPGDSDKPLQPSWTRKRNLSMIEQHKILKDEKEQNYDQLRSRYLDSFHQELQNNPNRFHITRGEFTNFIQKNNHYKPMGPLQGIERTMQRIEDTRKSVWIKSPSKRQEMTASLRYSSSLSTTVKSNIAKNSELICQKFRIRKNRERIQKLFKRDLENRKREGTNFTATMMNKEGAARELFISEPDMSGYIPRPSIDYQQDLQQFQHKLNRKFK